MSFSYDPTGASPIDRVRLLLGDTDGSAPDLQNEEIRFYCTLAGATVDGPMGALFRAALLAATALVGRYAAVVDFSATTHGTPNFKVGDRYTHYQSIAGSMQNLLARSPLVPYAGGLSIADKQVQDQHTDRVRPFFNREQGTISGTTDPSNTGSTLVDPQATTPL